MIDKKARDYLLAIPLWTKKKNTLDEVRHFLKELGNPDEQLNIIHVAGTNGKGSVCADLTAMLMEAGYHVGTFVSPHLTDVTERFLVDGVPVEEAGFSESFARVKAVTDRLTAEGYAHPTFFEFVFLMAMDLYGRRKPDFVVLETGLGGRLDTTNVIRHPLACVITSISLDHTQYLGDTVELIAAEKAGIIKKSIPFVLGEANAAYDAVFEQVAAANKTRVVYAEREFACEGHELCGDRQHFRMVRRRDGHVLDFDLDLLGEYQCRNVLTALATLDLLHEQTPLTISRRAFVDGAASAARTTALQGRWQSLGERPKVLCDTGHNAHGLAYVAEQLRRSHEGGRLYCVVGFSGDKDIDAILALLPRDAYYLFTQAASERALPVSELAARAAAAGLDGEAVATVPEAVTRAKALAAPADTIFIGGSTFVVAEVL